MFVLRQGVARILLGLGIILISLAFKIDEPTCLSSGFRKEK